MMFQGILQLAKTTQSNGRPNIEDPVIRQRLARLEGAIKAHEYSGLRQLTLSTKGEDPGVIQSMSKLIATNLGSEVAKIALDLLGDDGLLDPVDSGGMMTRPGSNVSWINQYMYSLGIAVAGGTANIQRNVIAERGLGLPRDVFADRSSGK
jgi:alkylation response protein AidB-like acyl-CoA dehydrogenase